MCSSDLEEDSASEGPVRSSDELEFTEILGGLWTFMGQGMRGPGSSQGPGGLGGHLGGPKL